MTDFRKLAQIGATGLLVAAAFVLAPRAAAQALHVETVGDGVELVIVAQPLTDATSVSWPEFDDEEELRVRTVSSGSLTLAADLERALSGEESAPAPGAVIVVGTEQVGELRGLVQRLVAGRPIARIVSSDAATMTEGGTDRRLGKPGADAIVRLELGLPPHADWRRASIEVLAELIPGMTAREVAGLLARVDGDRLVLEARVDPELAEMKLRRLRLSLARIAADTGLDRESVEEARLRVAVRRRAALEEHPASAERLAELWVEGGIEAVRHSLFAVGGVSLETVQQAAREWLPQHPGSATLYLPPRVFNPRFAPPPQTMQLSNDLSVSVLERPATTLAGLCLRPILLPDVDGDMIATVLARLATQLRAEPGAPGWIRVHSRPPVLELAAPPDSFAEVCESLQTALQVIAEDARPLTDSTGDARARALRLMALKLGLDDGVAYSPALLLRPGNLAIGAVTPDAEAATEALQKFGVGGVVVDDGPASHALLSSMKSREAVSGGESILVVGLPLPDGLSTGATAVVAEAIRIRAEQVFPEREVEVVRPLVPGRQLVLLLVRGAIGLDVLETEFEDGWPDFVAPLSEDELTSVRRPVAADQARRRSGVLGRARLCAAVAAGESRWSVAQELEMNVLSVSLEETNEIVAGFGPWPVPLTTGAGVLPIGFDSAAEER